MSYSAWKAFFENDVDSFRQHLACANQLGATRNVVSGNYITSISLSSSPKTPKVKRNAHTGSTNRGTGQHWTRAEINARDRQGLTILHHATSSRSSNAAEFVKILLDNPNLDLYVQDAENGWTALHRALYFGNIEIAHALMLRDIHNVMDFATTVTHVQAGGLVKIKDHEGNSPFEVFASTIAPRNLQDAPPATLDAREDTESFNGVDVRDEAHDGRGESRALQPRINLTGDDVFAFGSNKNLTLGLGDEDDRQFPERVALRRPEHLLRRLYKDHLLETKRLSSQDETVGKVVLPAVSSQLPAIIRNRAFVVQNMVMSKLHTAILTNDPVSNLHITGFGPGGRLGLGDETTRFNYVCIQGGLAHKRVASVALGQDHTIAICSTGEVFTWGNAQDGKLGYLLPESSNKQTPVQLVPRQLYGLVKKEQIVGAAASAVHSIIYTPTALFAFGRNSGQLGLVDADARSLEVQVIPRRVGTSILQSPIESVSAIDRATTVLMENGDVIVFTHYAWKKVIFPFEEAPNMLFSTALSTRYDRETNSILRITNGGNTICAVSAFGQVFTIDVPKESEHVPSSVSTTNPNKARNALPAPSRVWSIGKTHMAAADAAVGQDGSIILCTNSGSVWRKEKRANMKSIHDKPGSDNYTKDYKFVRVPNITRAIAVRSNARGAFGVIRKDCDVTREQIVEGQPALWDCIFPLLAFHDYGTTHDALADENAAEPQLRFWVPSKKMPSPSLIKHAVLTNPSVEEDFLHLAQRYQPLSNSQYDAWITSTVTDVRLPAHSFLLKARSKILRAALVDIEQSYYFSVPDLVSVEYGQDGQIEIKLHGADFLTLVNFVFYIYSENVIDVWHHTSRALHLAPRYRQIRVELMKIAAALDMSHLERSVRVMVDPSWSMMLDMESAYPDFNFFKGADVLIDLADTKLPAHSVLLCARCPFFEGLFHGRAGGMWMASRRNLTDGIADPIRVDLKHVNSNVFSMVLRHIYADTGEELFDSVVADDMDEFVDLVIDVISVANELMLDRLSQISQKVVGRYVNIRNVCGLLNTIAECAVTDFKVAALEYICLNLESMLEQRLLDELDDHLFAELDEIVRQNQLAYMPFARSGRADAELLDRYPELPENLERARQRRVDSMRLPTRYVDQDERRTPRQKKQVVEDDLPFTMDDDSTPVSPRMRANKESPSLRPAVSRTASNQASGRSPARADNFTASSVGTEHSDLPTPLQTPLNSPPPDAPMTALELPKAAWTLSSSKDTKLDLKSIMEQTSSTPRVSNLSQALNAASLGPSRSLPKLSQSQRKKQAQELKRQESVLKEVSKEISQDVDGGPLTPQSPWSRSTPKHPTFTTSSGLETNTPSNLPVSPESPMRPNASKTQTVVRAPSDTRDLSQRKTVRTVSSPTTAAEASKVVSTPPLPQIHSIRHIPRSSERLHSSVDAHTSMAEILAQEYADKIAIKEAAAKRSLQEIQQEQQFEAWWSAESRRVQEEEAEAVAAAERLNRGADSQKTSNRGRGTRKRISGRNTSTPGTGSLRVDLNPTRRSSQQEQPQPREVSGAEPTRGTGRGRGSHRGSRGRGKIQGKATPSPQNM